MLREDNIRCNQLTEVVHNIHSEDLVSDVRDADLDTVGLDDTADSLKKRVHANPLGTQREGEDFDGVKIVHDGDQTCR